MVLPSSSRPEQGNRLQRSAAGDKTSFHAGARFNPSAADLDAEIARTASKIRAGARFLISRPVYEPGPLLRMAAELAGEGIPILLSVAPLGSFEEADYLSHEVPDISIPQQTLHAMEQVRRMQREPESRWQ